VGVSRDCPNFLGTPYYLRNGKSYGLQMDFKFGGYIYRAYANNSTLKSFGEKGAWAYSGTAQIFWVPPIILGTGKATDFKFCNNINRVDRNKSPC